MSGSYLIGSDLGKGYLPERMEAGRDLVAKKMAEQRQASDDNDQAASAHMSETFHDRRGGDGGE